MDHIIDAVKRAKASQKPEPRKPDNIQHRIECTSLLPASSGSGDWDLSTADLDAKHLENHRIVSYESSDPCHIPFNVLRTKVYQTFLSKSWKSLAITSPTRDCGKTMVSVNLAFSLARQNNCRAVLIDLDLQKSSVATALGVRPRKSIGQFLEGAARLQECFIKVSENLFVALNSHDENQVFELARHQGATEIIPMVAQALDPDVIIVDLPPILANDDVISFLPHVDANMLIAAAGRTTAEEIEGCLEEFNDDTAFLGVVLNKCTNVKEEYYQ